MPLEICPHTDDHKAVIWKVYRFYCYDTSTEDDYDLEEDGLYSISAEYFAQYWTNSMFTESRLQPARQVADLDDRAVIVHVLEANRAAA